MSAPHHHGVHALIATKAKDVDLIVLTGGAIGNYRSGHGLGAPINFTGLGSINPLSRLMLKGTLLLNVPNPAGKLVLSTLHGKVYVTLSKASGAIPFSYTITGGTRKWTGVSGTGEAIVTMVPVGHSNPAHHGRISITFMNPSIL
jgi:hypothetical protein